MSFSLAIIFGVVPEPMMAWKPDSAPQAMVMNRNGNAAPGITGPPPEMYGVNAGICSAGLMNTMPTASAAMVPILR